MPYPFPKLGFTAAVREDLPHTAVVALEGPLDATTAPALLEGLEPLLSAGILRYVLDIRKVGYIYSLCDGILIDLSDAVRPRGGCVILVGMLPNMRVVFDMLGWGRFWDLADTVEDALNRIRALPPT